jgi:hypothetical protein
VPDYRHHAAAYGGCGYRVTEPGDIKAAVEQVLRHEAEGRLTVTDLMLNDFDPGRA